MKIKIIFLLSLTLLFIFSVWADFEENENENEINLVITGERIPEPEEVILPEEYFIDPILPAEIANEAIKPESASIVLHDEHFIKPIPEKTPASEETTVAETFIALPSVSVQVLSFLEKGWYVQAGSYSHPDIATSQIQYIGSSYPVFVFQTGASINPFLLLIGPLNQGESAAALQRVKSIGYRDAVVRRN